MRDMSTPDLRKPIMRAFLVLAVAMAGITAGPARAADAKSAPPAGKLALSATPAPKSAALVDAPRASTDDAPARKSGGTSWLPWIVLAVGAAAVAGTILVVNGG